MYQTREFLHSIYRYARTLGDMGFGRVAAVANFDDFMPLRQKETTAMQVIEGLSMRRPIFRFLAVGWAIVAVLASTSGSTAAPPTQVNAFNQVTNNLSNQVDNHVLTIPAGKRLAIDFFSAKGTVPAGDSVSDIHINNPVVQFFVVNAQGTDISGKSVFAATQNFHTTIGPFPVPTDVVVRMERKMFGSGTEAALAVTLAGQLLSP